MTNPPSLKRPWRQAAWWLSVALAFSACDDGENNTGDSDGGGGSTADALPVMDMGRDAAGGAGGAGGMGGAGGVGGIGGEGGAGGMGGMGGTGGVGGAPDCTVDDDCAVDSACIAAACVEGACVLTPIEGCCDDDGDCGEGGVCITDLAVCADAVAPGALVITELMIDPAERADADGEWIELYNPGDAPVVLNGLTLAGGEGEAHRIRGAGPITVDAGAWFLLARAADAAAPIPAGYLYSDVDLDNAGDRVAVLDAFGAVIDEVIYDGEWPIATGAALSLDEGAWAADANDGAAAWCPAVPSWGGEDRGTPGAANPACPRPEPIDWCRLQWPLDAEVVSGAEITAYGRVFEAGVTDRTDATDVDPQLRAQFGVGPDGSEPADNAAWTWADAEANAGWDAAESGEPGNDEYQITLNAPGAGVYDHAFRFSADGGQSWTYCDRQIDGSDGAADGYQVANAGSLTVTPGPCDDNPCVEPSPPRCDGNDLVSYAAVGECTPTAEGGFTCEYPEANREACADAGQVCAEGACAAPEPLAAPGEVIFTEILYDPHGVLIEDNSEWFEVHNVTDGPRRLDGCTLVDSTPANAEIVGRLAIPAGGYAVFVRSADQAINGGIEADATFGFALNNSGDTLSLTCDGQLVDQVIYTDAEPFPVNARQQSIQLNPETLTGDANDDGAAWCFGEPVYYEDALDEADNHRGTPGQANPPCPIIDVTVDWCRLQSPLDLEAPAATPLTVFGRVFEAGITDRSEGTDADEGLMVEVGVGPDGSDPAADCVPGDGVLCWVWTPAVANPAWQDAAEPGNDEYQGTFNVPAPGPYDFAVRATRDGGATWLYCDRAAGDGADGAEDGYSPDNAGQLTSTPSPCEIEACDVPPAAECDADGVTRVTYVAPGACSVEGVDAVCTYNTETLDCSLTGGTCEAGACVGGARAPAAGEVIFTEFLPDPHDPLADATAEWLEVLNTTDSDLDLTGCVLVDGTAANAEILPLLVLAAGERAVFANSDDAALNGGLPAPAYLFSFGLNNGGDQLSLTCGDVVVDAIDYAADPFPTPERRASVQRDAAGRWCVATDVYFGEADGAHLGTPGAENPACPGVARCTLQWPPQIDGAPGDLETVYGRVVVPGITDQNAAGNDLDDRVMGRLVVGPVADPLSADALRIAAEPNPGWAGEDPAADEYQVALALPAPGLYAYAFEFSADRGRTWLACDLDGGENGFQVEQAGQLASRAAGDACDPNPCDAPPAAECDAETGERIRYAALGDCVDEGGVPACTYAPAREACGADEICLGGACVPAGARAPLAGEIIFTELMYDPHGDVLAEGAAEWIEIRNVAAEPLTLDGCVVAKAADTAALDGLILAPGAYAVLTQAGADVNGGIAPDAAFAFALTNGGTSLAIRCGADDIDLLTYDDAAPWPRDAQRHSISLDPAAHTADGNDDGGQWCYGRAAYWLNDALPSDDHHGTPGEANPPCDEPVDFCRLQFPAAVQVAAGEPVAVGGRIFEAGTTDRTPLNDVRQPILAQVGVGPDGSLPGMDADGLWAWSDADANGEYDGNGALGEPNNDEYVATIIAPADGAYDLAYRFSADGGRTWTYCDGGDAGSSDGYDPANAGALTVAGVLDPCDPNPCDAPAADCADDVTARSYVDPGACAVVDGAASCTYDEVLTPCADGEQCAAGVCGAPAARAPVAGEVIFSEVLYDPHGDLSDNDAEWYELHNTTAEALSLATCAVTANGSGGPIGDLEIPAGGYLVFVKSPDVAINGGLAAAGSFNFALANGGSTLVLDCGGEIDTLAYDDVAPWPLDAQRHSISLDVDALTAADNDDGARWCYGRATYRLADDPANEHFGTPGAANPPCDEAVDFCRLQFPLVAEAAPGAELVVGGRLYEEGVTDRTAFTDPRQHVLAQVGFGPDGSLPAEDADGLWAWVDAAPNAAYDGNGEFGEPSNDEYVATFPAPAPGVYDHAFRVSVDGGRTWTYCDGGDAGSSDGYDPANAGAMTTAVVGDPCDPNPCDAPPAADCADDVTAQTYAAPGACAVVDGLAACTYAPTPVPCADGEVCADGACRPALARAPAAGEVIFSEILYDPHGALSDNDAEWFELHNTTAEPLNLATCSVTSNGNGGPIGEFEIPAGGYVFFVKSADAALNGDLVPTGTFNFALGNGGATLVLDCGGEVDSVAYDDVAPWPVDAQFHSISLDPGALTAAGNDDGAAWCYSSTLYYGPDGGADDHRGTPGAANPPCDTPVDFCRLQSPVEIDGQPGQVVDVYGRVFHAGTTDRTAGTDVRQYLRAELGLGPVDTAPMGNADWTWARASANAGWDAAAAGAGDEDEYVAALTVPGEGLYAFAYRVTVDGGRTWTYCDRDAGSSDGYAIADGGLILSIAPDVCDPNPCDAPPAADCADDVTRRTYPAVGACADVGGEATCDYAADAVLVACAPGEQCLNGACQPAGVRAPLPGEVVFSEIMYAPHTPLADASAEWFELTNTAGVELSLAGCAVSAAAGETVIGALDLAADGVALFAQSEDPALTGGLVPDALFDFFLSNSGATLTLTCGGELIDSVTYSPDAPWPADARYHSLSLDPGALNAAANDEAGRWCYGSTAYYLNDRNPPTDHFGSPGELNPPCDTPVDFCRLQFPTEIDGQAGATVTVYGRVYQPNITDRTAATDARLTVRGQLGWGPDGADPADWMWMDAAPNADWAAPADNNEDEYQADLVLPAEGLYAYGYRFTVDGGRTWTLCDGDAEGSSNGFNSPGVLLSNGPIDPCAGACQDAPAAECADANTVRTFEAPGACDVVGGEPVCSFAPIDTPCADGEICEAGACVVLGPRAPLAGEVIFSEIMYDPHGVLADGTAEWFELHNTAAEPLDLEGCVFTANGNGGALGALVVAPGDYVVVGQSADPAVNGGLVPDAVLGFALGNGGSELILTCGDVAVDTVAYDDANGWPLDAQRHSISLDGELLDGDLNDLPEAWCFGRGLYFANDVDPVDDHRGTPGAANPPCDEAVDFCRLQFPTEIDAEAGTAVTVYGRLYEEGTTDRTAGTDARQYVGAQLGWGPDGADPADWAWINAAPNVDWAAPADNNDDEYQATLVVPAEGLYAYGYRFTVDGGRTWTLCDGDAEGSTNGFNSPGVLLSNAVADPCAGACQDAPAAECADANTARTFEAPGACEVVGGEPVCSFAPIDTPCAAGEVCDAGVCAVPPVRGPAVGEIVINEVMYDPSGSLEDATAEWAELKNLTNEPLSLAGCRFTANGSGGDLGANELAPNGFFLIGRSADLAVNGGIFPDVVLSFNGLGNGGSTLLLVCDGVTIDTVVYDDAAPWPRDALRHSISLDVEVADADLNDLPEAWCYGRDLYYRDEASAADDHRGTPGAENPPCDKAVDFCRLAEPLALEGLPGEAFTVHGRLVEAGLTDRTSGTDVRQYVRAEVGLGPADSSPVDNVDWSWQAAQANPDWDAVAADAGDEDDYQASLSLPDADGIYEYTFRVTVDDGRTWTYCDADGGDYTIGNAGIALAAAPTPVDWCRFQWNPDVTAQWGDVVQMYGQVYKEGVTDQPDAAGAAIIGQFGFGPDGEAPEGSANWVWQDAAPNADWDFVNNANDEYVADAVMPEVVGTFDSAYRFSTDNGESWVYCDAGDPGIADGFNNPGNLVIEVRPFAAAEVQDKFNTTCAGCHTGGGSSGGLNLDVFEETTIGVAAIGSALNHIEPGAPERSYLMAKLVGVHRDAPFFGAGNRMPIGQPWTDNELLRLAAYIQALPPVP